MNTTDMNKKEYLAPTMSVIDLLLEQGIAAGSAFVKPQNSGNVQQEWETEDDVTRTFNWN